jgi:flagellar L-ring protein precursor FlgH
MKPRLAALTALLLGASAPALHAGSLWVKESNNEAGLASDLRARRLGDILTIVVTESVTSTNTTDVKTSRDSNPSSNIVGNMLNQFIGGVPKMLGLKANGKVTLPTGQVVKGPVVTAPNLTTTGTDDYHYGGTATSAQTVTTRAAVTVVDVLPNGNLVVEGTRIVSGNREKTCAYLRGIVRAADVQKDNTVSSSNIADMQLDFVPEGSLSDVRKGWLQRLNDKIRPY